MIDLLIAFLQSLRGEKLERIMRLLANIFCVLIAVGLIIIAGYIIKSTSFSSYFTVSIGVLMGYIGILIIIAVFRAKGQPILADIVMPLLAPLFIRFSLLLIKAGSVELAFLKNFIGYIGEKWMGILSLIAIIYPVLLLHQIVFRKLTSLSFLKLLSSLSLTYTLGFFFFAIFFSFSIFDSAWMDELNRGFLSGLIYFFVFLILFTYPLISLRHLYLRSGIEKFAWGVMLFGVILSFFYSSKWIGTYYEGQIQKAENIFVQDGEVQKTYQDAKKIFFLKQSFLYALKKNKISENQKILFQKLYDNTPEGYFGEKLYDNNRTRSTNATNMTEVGEKAHVVLKLAEIEHNTIEEKGIPLLETTYRFHFFNETTTNQEVVIFFEAPSQYSVVTDLALGLNLEFPGQIAARGAAKKVYEDSLRINKDPALIEKMGINTYSLRVFPIPSTTDSIHKGRQQVQLTLLSPVEEDFLYAPKFSFVNLKITDESSLIAKIYDHTELIQEDIVQEKEVETYLMTDHILNQGFKGGATTKIGDICIPENMLNLLQDPYLLGPGGTSLSDALSGTNTLTNKISIFFDNSQSIKNSKANIFYPQIFKIIKDSSEKLYDIDIYRYNFMVEKLATVEDIEYRGYSDIDSVLDYIEKNGIQHQTILLLTDDESFNFQPQENKGRNFASLATNKFVVVKIGEKVKTYKSDFTNLLSATQGNIYTLTTIKDMGDLFPKIFASDSNEHRFKNCSYKKPTMVVDDKSSPKTAPSQDKLPSDSDLVGYWSFDSQTYNVQDDSGYGNHAEGANVGTQIHGASFSTGIVGRAPIFNTEGGYLRIGDNSILEPQRLTFSARAKSTTPTWNDYGWILSKRDETEERTQRAQGYIIHPEYGTKSIRVYIAIDGARRSIFYTPEDITIWHHYLATYDGSYLKFYVDGTLVSVGYFPGSITYGDSALYIGRDGFSTERLGDGMVDEVRVYDRALTSSEVRDLYNRHSDTITNTYLPKGIIEPISVITGKVNQLIAGYVGNRLLGFVKNSNDRTTVADLQNKLAKSYMIVNQFNSLIALENERQQYDLTRYEQQGDKYDATKSLNDGPGAVGGGGSNASPNKGWFTTNNAYADPTDSIVGMADGYDRVFYAHQNDFININRNTSRGSINVKGTTMILIVLIYVLYTRQIILLCITIIKNKRNNEQEETATAIDTVDPQNILTTSSASLSSPIVDVDEHDIDSENKPIST